MAETITVTYVSPREAGQYIGASERTLTEWRRTGRGPRYTRWGGPTGRVRYSIGDLDAFMAASRFAHTSQEGAR